MSLIVGLAGMAAGSLMFADAASQAARDDIERRGLISAQVAGASLLLLGMVLVGNACQ